MHKIEKKKIKKDMKQGEFGTQEFANYLNFECTTILNKISCNKI